MVDDISNKSNIIYLSERRPDKFSNNNSLNSASGQLDLKRIAEGIFQNMVRAARQLVLDENNLKAAQELENSANSLLVLKISSADRIKVLQELEKSLLNCDEETGLHIANELKSLSIHLELNSWQDFEIFENASSLASLHKLHEPTKDTNNPNWQKGLIEILEKTSVPEAGRIMIYDNLAGLYDHHLHMYMLNKKQEPKWDIVQAASFILDIADEEFRQEKDYDKKNNLSLETDKATDKLIPPVIIAQKRLERDLAGKYESTNDITLRTDFKKAFIYWIEANLDEFKEAGFSLSPLKIFTDLSLAAKAGQALRLGSERK